VDEIIRCAVCGRVVFRGLIDYGQNEVFGEYIRGAGECRECRRSYCRECGYDGDLCDGCGGYLF